ncbi:hypothetical protein ACFQ4Z_02635 [Oceanobacillus oncorhynchi subsp. oncorhynchi]|uniref:hypothetical protein n=1 Tax=Oceanobacillus oncorhynchi TaxID=545501 RepID=UPI0036314EDD
MANNTSKMNPFVQMYKDYQSKGKSMDEAFILTVPKIAWKGGTIDDLQELELAHMQDIRTDFDQIIKEVGEDIYERTTV